MTFTAGGSQRPPISGGKLVTLWPATKNCWPHFWAVQLVLFVLIAMYCTIHELTRVIGKEKLPRIFFGPLPVPQV
jgi:hypothetical protein